MSDKKRIVAIIRSGKYYTWEGLADLLIAEGFCSRKSLEYEQIQEMQEHKEFCAIAEKKVNELTHRAEVAERALYNALEKFPCAQCGFDCPDFSDYDEEAKYCNKKWLEQAEKELAEGK